jgi:hypothetical protein
LGYGVVMRVKLSCAFVSLAMLCLQCGGDDTAGTAGSANTGGAANSGGARGTGGVSNTGGSTNSGGASGSAQTGGGPNADASATESGGSIGSGGSASGSGGGDSGRAGAGGTADSGGVRIDSGADGARADAAAESGVIRDASVDVRSDVASSDASAGDAALPYNPCPPVGQPCKILPLGDSITDGFTVAGGYRIELFRAAHAAGKNITFVGSQSNGPGMVDGVTFPQSHEGHVGFTIDAAPVLGRAGISGGITDSAMANFTPHIVTLLIGTNDVDLSNDLANADTRLGALMDEILRANANALLVVAQIIPTGTDAENTRILAYNAGIPGLVQARVNAGKHVMMVDMYSAFMANANFRSLLADNLHPNTDGYTVMGQVWYQALSNIIH